MAETTDQVKADIARTRDYLGNRIDELQAVVDARIAETKSKIPFAGISRQRMMIMAATAAGGVLLTFVALAALRRDSATDAMQEAVKDTMRRRRVRQC